MQAEVEVDVPLQVPGQHGGHHKVGLVDGDQVRHLLVLHVRLELRLNHDPVNCSAVVDLFSGIQDLSCPNCT